MLSTNKILSKLKQTVSVLTLSAILLESTLVHPSLAMDPNEQETTRKRKTMRELIEEAENALILGYSVVNSDESKQPIDGTSTTLKDVKEEPDASRGVHTREYINEKMPLVNPQNGKRNCLKCAVSGYRFLNYQTSAPDKVDTRGPRDWNYSTSHNGRDIDLIDFDQASLLPSGKIQLAYNGEKWVEEVSIEGSAPITFKETSIDGFHSILKILPFKPWYNDSFQTGLLFLPPSYPEEEGGHWINFYSYKKENVSQVDLLIDFQHKEIFDPSTLSEYVKIYKFSPIVYVWYESSRQALGQRLPIKPEGSRSTHTSPNQEENLYNTTTTTTTMTAATDKPYSSDMDVTNPSPNSLSTTPASEKEKASNESMEESEKEEERSLHGDSNRNDKESSEKSQRAASQAFKKTLKDQSHKKNKKRKREEEESSLHDISDNEKDDIAKSNHRTKKRKGAVGVSIEIKKKTFDNLTEEDKEKLRNGKSQTKLAIDFDVTQSTICKWQKKLGVPTKVQKKIFEGLTEKDKKNLRNGKSQAKLARDFDVAQSTICKWQKKLAQTHPVSTDSSQSSFPKTPREKEKTSNKEKDGEASISEDSASAFEESVEENGESFFSSTKVGEKRKGKGEEGLPSLTTEEETEIKRLRETTDLSGEAIATAMGLKPTIVCEYLNSIGIFTAQHKIALTEEQKSKIKELSKDPSKRRIDITRETGCSDYLVNKYIQMIGQPKHWKRQPLTEDEKSQAKTLATTTTLSWRKIASKVGRDHKVVNKYLDSIGIPTKQRYLTEEQKARIAELAPGATITYAAIARTVGCKRGQVSNYLKTIGAPKCAKGKRLTPEQKALITQYTGEGKTPYVIGPLVKADAKTVRKYLASVALKEQGTSAVDNKEKGDKE